MFPLFRKFLPPSISVFSWILLSHPGWVHSSEPEINGVFCKNLLQTDRTLRTDFYALSRALSGQSAESVELRQTLHDFVQERGLFPMQAITEDLIDPVAWLGVLAHPDFSVELKETAVLRAYWAPAIAKPKGLRLDQRAAPYLEFIEETQLRRRLEQSLGDIWFEELTSPWLEPIARDNNGEILRMTYAEAERYCRSLNSRLPSARDFAREAARLGAGGIGLGPDVRGEAQFVPATDVANERPEPFHFEATGYRSPRGEAGYGWAWTSSFDSRFPQSAWVWFGGLAAFGSHSRNEIEPNPYSTVRCLRVPFR